MLLNYYDKIVHFLLNYLLLPFLKVYLWFRYHFHMFHVQNLFCAQLVDQCSTRPPGMGSQRFKWVNTGTTSTLHARGQGSDGPAPGLPTVAAQLSTPSMILLLPLSSTIIIEICHIKFSFCRVESADIRLLALRA